MPVTWTEESIEYLKEQRADHVSFGVIADALGITRSAAIGKAHRLGLLTADRQWPRKHKPAGYHAHRKPRQPKPKSQFLFDTKKSGPKPPTLLDLPLETSPHAVTLLHLGKNTCRWPISGQGISTMFCGAAPVPDRAYCGLHCARARA